MPCLGQVGGKQRQVGEELYSDGELCRSYGRRKLGM